MKLGDIPFNVVIDTFDHACTNPTHTIMVYREADKESGIFTVECEHPDCNFHFYIDD